MKKPSRLLAPAILLTLMPFMFQFDGTGVTWTWTRHLPLAAVLLASGVVFWGLYFRARTSAGR